MMKFRPQVESLSERIVPDASSTLAPISSTANFGTYQAQLPQVTDAQLQTAFASFGLANPLASASTISNFTNQFATAPLGSRADAIWKEIRTLGQERNQLADQLLQQVAAADALTAAYTILYNAYNAEVARLLASGWTKAQIDNDSTVRAMFDSAKAVFALQDAAMKQVQVTQDKIREIDTKVRALFDELLSLPTGN